MPGQALDQPARCAFAEVGGFERPQVFADFLHALVHDLVGFAGMGFEGADVVGQIVQHVRHVQRLQHPETEIDRVLEAGLLALLADAVVLLEADHAEAVEAGIAQREPVFGGIRAEPAGAAGAGREKDEAVHNLRPGHAGQFHLAEVLDQAPAGEVSGAALPVVAVLFSDMESRLVRGGERLALVPGTVKNGFDELVVLAREAAHEDRGCLPLDCAERPFLRPAEVLPGRPAVRQGGGLCPLRITDAVRTHIQSAFQRPRRAKMNWIFGKRSHRWGARSDSPWEESGTNEHPRCAASGQYPGPDVTCRYLSYRSFP